MVSCSKPIHTVESGLDRHTRHVSGVHITHWHNKNEWMNSLDVLGLGEECASCSTNLVLAPGN